MLFEFNLVEQQTKTKARITARGKEKLMKLKVSPKGVWLDNQEVKGCTQVDIKNINPIKDIEVLLHLTVDEVDVRYHSKEILQIKE